MKRLELTLKRCLAINAGFEFSSRLSLMEHSLPATRQRHFNDKFRLLNANENIWLHDGFKKYSLIQNVLKAHQVLVIV
ncbi:hypothetical protein A7M65_19695 [Acinetobacter baumannii]|nr:hypothetical protein A7M65_19695 [Acinetobacter baumannii]